MLSWVEHENSFILFGPELSNKEELKQEYRLGTANSNTVRGSKLVSEGSTLIKSKK